MFWNNTITLYNRHTNDQGEVKWYRHIINDCFVKHTKKSVNNGSTRGAVDENIIRIPVQQNYVSPFVWANLTEDKKTEKLTIQSGDLIILGEVSDTIDEYSGGIRSNDIIAKYETLGSVTVDEIRINTALPNQHYFVRGI